MADRGLNITSLGHSFAGGDLCICGHHQKQHVKINAESDGSCICMSGSCQCFEFEKEA